MVRQPTMNKTQFMGMQEDLMEGYSNEDFQRRLHAGWYSTSDQVEKMQWKANLCLEVQGPVIAQYGFEASRRGVSQTLKLFWQNFSQEQDIRRYNEILAWLVDPDLQAMEPEGPGGSMAKTGGPKNSRTSMEKELLQFGGKQSSPYVGAWAYGEEEHQKFKIHSAGMHFCRIDLQAEQGGAMLQGFFHGNEEIVLMELKRGETEEIAGHLILRSAGPGCLLLNFSWGRWPPDFGDDRLAWRESSCKVVATSADDASAISGVERVQSALAGAHQAMYRPVYPDLQQEQWFRVLGCDSIQESLECGLLILRAEMPDGQVVGYISCACTYETSRRSPATPSCGSQASASDDEEGVDDGGPHCKINHISVLPDHRGRGIGRMLFEELLVHLSVAAPSVASDLRLRVVEANAFAIEWYRRLGFTVTRRLDAHCGPCPVVFVEMRWRRDGSTGAEAEEH